MAHYHLGLPAWAFAGWNNVYFTSKPSALASYASVFNTVEGNTTFYHIPDEATVDSWYQSVSNTNFRFCFKLPKTITHQNRPNFADLDLFFKRIQPLQNNCGPVLLQFPSTVGPGDLSRIESIVAKIPPDYHIALEVRHEDFFSQPQHLEPLLAKYHLGRVIMDTRPVFEGNRDHPEVLAALHQKPDLPVPGQVYNGLLLVRLLLHPDIHSNDAYMEQWVQRTVRALAGGCDCYIMIHCPNNQHCPMFAASFHERLIQQYKTHQGKELDPLPAWPIPQQQNLL